VAEPVACSRRERALRRLAAQDYGPDGLVEIRLADLVTGRVSVIARGHLQAPFFDGGLLVWPAGGRPGALTRLHADAAAAGRPAALPAVLTVPAGISFSNIGMARGAIAWTTTRTTYLASTTTGGYVQVTADFGFAVTDSGPDVLVSDAPARKAAQPRLALHVLDAAGIGRGTC
jgi:hypothetical protein